MIDLAHAHLVMALNAAFWLLRVALLLAAIWLLRPCVRRLWWGE